VIAWLQAQPLSTWLIWLAALLGGMLGGAVADLVRQRRENARITDRLAEARTVRMELMERLERSAGAQNVLRRERDAMAEAAGAVAKLAQLDALKERSPGAINSGARR
jgi:hypothetical protein